MYKGEVKVADAEMQQFLQLGKMLQVKGLCSVELHEKQKQINNDAKKETAVPPEKSTNEKLRLPDDKTNMPIKIVEHEHIDSKQTPLLKKRKLPSPAPPDPKKKNLTSTPDASSDTKMIEKFSPSSPVDDRDTKNEKNMLSSSSVSGKDVSRVPRPPNAFMIFANQWRKKLAVEYPNESNKDISVRLGNMWKSLSPETKDAFYEDARKADEEHKEKYPGYYYSPKEARHRKAIASITRAVHKLDQLCRNDLNDITEPEFIEIKCENDLDSGRSTPKSSNSH
ncbi:transcription factor Sox-7-like isoform X2 [Zophobas morio]